MKEYRIDVFYNNTINKAYFDNRDEAIIFGVKQLNKTNVTAVFLLNHLIDGKYNVNMQIQ